jgi:hypothetical protein
MCVQDMEVVYLENEADDTSDLLPWYVTEEAGKSANINYVFGGK